MRSEETFMKRRVVLACCLLLAISGPLEAEHYFISIPPEGQAKYKEANFALRRLPAGAAFGVHVFLAGRG